MSRDLRVVHGGQWGAPPRRATLDAPYQIAVNQCGVTYVWFRWSPTTNLYDCIMTLDEAIERGFVRSHFGLVRAEGHR